MSEFKFACPVCGQHITADSQASGTQLDCPTCFRKIVVPQAPASGETKFILAASHAEKSRPPSALETAAPAARPKTSYLPAIFFGLVLLACAGGAGVFLWRAAAARKVAAQREAIEKSAEEKRAAAKRSAHPVSTNSQWTLTGTNAVIPAATAGGRIQGKGFFCERATLQGGMLTLRQGKAWPPDLGVTVLLFANQGEQLSNQTIEISPERTQAPSAILRWKDENEKAVTRRFTNGYLMKLEFGQATNARMPGKIYMAFPDASQSFVAGTFQAEIRKPAPPKPKTLPRKR